MKSIKTMSILALSIALMTTACNQKSKDNSARNAALLYVGSLLSGNCATIVKQEFQTNAKTGQVGNLYTATGSSVPRGGCNASTLGPTYTTDSTTAASYYKAFYTNVSTTLNAQGSSCSTYKSAADTAAAGSNTSVYVTAATVAANVDTNTNCLASSATYSYNNGYGVTIYCKNQAAIDFQSGLTQYNGISDAMSDMATNVIYQKAFLNDSTNGYGFTSTAVGSARLATTDELSLQKDQNYAATAFVQNAITGVVTALVTGGASLSTAQTTAITAATTCNKALLAQSKSSTVSTDNAPAVKSFLLAQYGNTSSSTVTGTINSVNLVGQYFGFSSTDANGVTAAIIQPKCGYGDAFSYTSTTISGRSYNTMGECPSTYPQF